MRAVTPIIANSLDLILYVIHGLLSINLVLPQQIQFLIPMFIHLFFGFLRL